MNWFGTKPELWIVWAIVALVLIAIAGLMDVLGTDEGGDNDERNKTDD